MTTITVTALNGRQFNCDIDLPQHDIKEISQALNRLAEGKDYSLYFLEPEKSLLFFDYCRREVERELTAR